jgi:hypothetical protein
MSFYDADSKLYETTVVYFDADSIFIVLYM